MKNKWYTAIKDRVLTKSLIYNNFQFGQNLVIDNSIQNLNYEDAEKKLREIKTNMTLDKNYKTNEIIQRTYQKQ